MNIATRLWLLSNGITWIEKKDNLERNGKSVFSFYQKEEKREVIKSTDGDEIWYFDIAKCFIIVISVLKSW